ncbi:MAG: CDC48 family AAA ATPase [Nitrososphaerales archaeon]
MADARQRDVGKRRARIDLASMKKIGLSSGDVVELRGNGVTAVTVWPSDPEDRYRGIVRLDGQTRKNTGVGLGHFVTLEKNLPKIARSIVLAPLNTRLTPDKEFCEFVKRRIRGMPFTVGDEISVVVLGNTIIFSVVKVTPHTVVKVDQDSHLSIRTSTSMKRTKLSEITYEQVGGLKDELRRLREIVELPLRHPQVFARLGIEPPKGILLHGPPGCGKTLLAKALANESEINFLSLEGPEIMNKYYGETEARLREIFKEAREHAPSIIFIDEIDSIAPRREESLGDVEKRVVAQLLGLMDGLSDRGNVIIIGATNRPEGLDPALRRPGRFDREVEIGVPNPQGRLEILEIHTRGMPLKAVNLEKLSEQLYGFSGADLRWLCKEAALKALRRYIPSIDMDRGVHHETVMSMVVTIEDFQDAAKGIIPSALREFSVEKPTVGWQEIGGLEEVKKTLQENVIWAIRKADMFRKAGVIPARGILLYGPHGCGKTILARALARESGANFISIRGPEVLSKWVGESEKTIREIFRKAKAASPSLIFFDEIDSIANPSSYDISESNGGGKILSQLLTELDAVNPEAGTHVVAATSRPDLVDSSLLRPGRLDLRVFVPAPDEIGRTKILEIIVSQMPLRNDVITGELAILSKGYTGADLESLCREAAIGAMHRDENLIEIRKIDFDRAFSKIQPSITPEIESWYSNIQEKFRGFQKNKEGAVYA